MEGGRNRGREEGREKERKNERERKILMDPDNRMVITRGKRGWWEVEEGFMVGINGDEQLELWQQIHSATYR